MKQRWVMFGAGVFVGVALGVGVGMWGAKNAAERRYEAMMQEARERGTWEGPRSGGGRDGGPAAKAGSREGGSSARGGNGPEGLLAMIVRLSQVEDESEVNFLELVRQAHGIAQMSETEILGLLAMLEGEEAKEMMGGDDNEFRLMVGALALARMAELNGPEAMRLLLAGGEGSLFEDEGEDVAVLCLNSWVEADPEGALRWFEEMKKAGGEGPMSELISDPDFAAVLVGALARTNKEMAGKFLDEADAETRTGGMEAMARYETTTEGMRRLLATTGEAEVEARSKVIDTWAGRDPVAAAAWLEAQGAINGREQLVRDVAEGYLAKDPAAGAEWYMAQEVAPEREGERYTTVVRNWAWQDEAAAGAWLERQPDGPNRDQAEANMAGVAGSNGNWEDALGWAGGISDAALREKSLNQVFSRSDGRNGQLPEGFAEAAEAAGQGEALETYLERRNK